MQHSLRWYRCFVSFKHRVEELEAALEIKSAKVQNLTAENAETKWQLETREHIESQLKADVASLEQQLANAGMQATPRSNKLRDTDTLPVSRDLGAVFENLPQESQITPDLDILPVMRARVRNLPQDSPQPADLDTLPVVRARAGSLNDINPSTPPTVSFNSLPSPISCDRGVTRARASSDAVPGAFNNTWSQTISSGVRPPTIQFSDDDDI